MLRRPDGLPVALCNNCYLWYVSGLPLTDEIHQLYQGYWNSFRPKDLSDDYAAKIVSATDPYQDDVRLNRLAALAGGIEGKRLLEIGCGCGELLACARTRGATVFGNEISKEACDFVKEKLHIPVLQGEISEIDIINEFGKMDMIVMSDLFEHLIDPLATFRSALNILNTDGLLLIVTPNGGAAADTVESGTNWVGFRVDLEHLQYASTRTISALANRHRCEIEHLETYGYPVLDGIDVLPVPTVFKPSITHIIKVQLKKSQFLRSVARAIGAMRSSGSPQPDPSCGTYILFTILRKVAS